MDKVIEQLKQKFQLFKESTDFHSTCISIFNYVEVIEIHPKLLKIIDKEYEETYEKWEKVKYNRSIPDDDNKYDVMEKIEMFAFSPNYRILFDRIYSPMYRYKNNLDPLLP